MTSYLLGDNLFLLRVVLLDIEASMRLIPDSAVSNSLWPASFPPSLPLRPNLGWM